LYSSGGKRTPGHLSHQGPPIPRWALFEASYQGSRMASPDHPYYADVAKRIDANRAALSAACKFESPLPEHRHGGFGERLLSAAK
jgi:hypothetical protein